MFDFAYRHGQIFHGRLDAVQDLEGYIAMGHSVQMEVIAEGVEHEDQVRVLQDLDCDCIQGSLLSQPSPPNSIESLLSFA